MSGSCNEHNGLDVESIIQGFASHLRYGLVRDRYSATFHNKYVALASAIRDRLIERWIETQQTHYEKRVKRVYYMSLEYLLGRALGNNVMNLGIERSVERAMRELGLDWQSLRDEEVDPALGNGGLGRLAACFQDSLATLEIPAVGYGLRYDYGLFRQRIEHGEQVESADDWLRWGTPWEIPRPEFRIEVGFGGKVDVSNEGGRLSFNWNKSSVVYGTAYDWPIVGFGGGTVNTLRMWSACASEEFDFQDFNSGDYIAAVESKLIAENLTKVLYPNDNIYAGRELRLKQQYFFTACSLHDIIRRFKKDTTDWNDLPQMAAIQLNDTHPSLAVPELMRLLVDRENVAWDDAWRITTDTISYTNHTLLPEAFETWPVPMLKKLLPRHLQIIQEINRRFVEKVSISFKGDFTRRKRMSIISEDSEPKVRMANLAMVGSHAVNGVAEIHTKLLREEVVSDFDEMFPGRIINITNGITPRRWLLKANPRLATLTSEFIGDDWITNLEHLRNLERYVDDPSFIERFADVKRRNKASFSDFLAAHNGIIVDPNSLFDVHAKRLHEYKRQLLSVLHILVLYNRIKNGDTTDMVPRTFLFAAKAAPGYEAAKRIIKLINRVAELISTESACDGLLSVHFLPNYRVSLAERLIPATDLSEQISTAGTEASGTGNMKFMLNGAITIGTHDGANIEMAREAGAENILLFGLKANEIAAQTSSYTPRDIFDADEEIKAALDMLVSPELEQSEAGVFAPIHHNLLEPGEKYFHLADLRSYIESQNVAAELWQDKTRWTQMAIRNVAAVGYFSSDRAVKEYAEKIWFAGPCPVSKTVRRSDTIREARMRHEK